MKPHRPNPKSLAAETSSPTEPPAASIAPLICRRLCVGWWTLAHAHGTLLGLVSLAFAATLRMFSSWPAPGQRFASTALLAATVLMPAGFFLGGLFIYNGDPGLGILLVPIGGILLFVAVLKTALALKYFSAESNTKVTPSQK